MAGGSVVVTRKPGWWYSGTIAGSVAACAVAVVLFVRRRGHLGGLSGLTSLIALPLGLARARGTRHRVS